MSLVFKRKREEVEEFEVSLDCIGRKCFKIVNKINILKLNLIVIFLFKIVIYFFFRVKFSILKIGLLW